MNPRNRQQLHVVQDGAELRLLVLHTPEPYTMNAYSFDLETGNLMMSSDGDPDRRAWSDSGGNSLDISSGGRLATSARFGLIYWLDCPGDGRQAGSDVLGNCSLAAFGAATLERRFNLTMPFARQRMREYFMVPQSIVVNDALGTVNVALGDSRVIALDAQTGQAAFQLGFRQPDHTGFISSNGAKAYHRVASSARVIVCSFVVFLGAGYQGSRAFRGSRG